MLCDTHFEKSALSGSHTLEICGLLYINRQYIFTYCFQVRILMLLDKCSNGHADIIFFEPKVYKLKKKHEMSDNTRYYHDYMM